MIKVDGIAVDYSPLPESHRKTAELYIEMGYEPGSGWMAILRNDLRAILVVDQETLAVLPQIYRWLVNFAPSQCWGSKEKVAEWMRTTRCAHEHLDMDGICHRCGADRRGI